MCFLLCILCAKRIKCTHNGEVSIHTSESFNYRTNGFQRNLLPEVKTKFYEFNFYANRSKEHRIFGNTKYNMIYLLPAVGLSPGGRTHLHTQKIHRTTQITTNVEECGPCPVFGSFSLAFALQLRKSA